MNNKMYDFWILIGIGIILNVFYLFGQTSAIINYDFAVSIQLQEPVNDVTEVGVALNKGFGLGDTLVYIPLFILGIVGLLKKTSLGLFAMLGAMAITIYWPIVALSTLYYAYDSPGWHFSDYTSYTILLSLIVIYGIWGFVYLYKNRNRLVNV